MNMQDKIKEQFAKKSFRLGGYSVLVSVIVIAIAVFAVMSVDSLSTKYTKLDMTNASIYSLSEESVNIAKAVDKDVTIYLLAQTGSEDTYTKNIIEKYAGYNDKIKVEAKDPVVFPSFAKQYTDENITNNSLIITCGAKSRYIPSSDIYKTTTDYSSYSQTTEFDAENQITSAINFVVSDDLPKLYYTSGHGEGAFSSQTASELVKQNITTEEISLLTASQIPDDADLLVINNPQSDIAQNEKDLLLNYLKNGGKLVLISGYTGTDMPVLNELMSNYGVTGENKLVYESDAKMYLTGYNYFLVPDMQSSDITDPIIRNNYPVLMPLSYPIVKTESSASAADVTDLLTTSSKAYTKTNVESMNNPEKQPEDKEGKYTVGVWITDTTDNGEAQIAWFSSAQMLDDSINQMVGGANRDLFLNAINSMCEREESVAIHAKSLQSESLTVPSGVKNLWSIVFIFLIPALFIAAGIYVSYKRKHTN